MTINALEKKHPLKRNISQDSSETIVPVVLKLAMVKVQIVLGRVGFTLYATNRKSEIYVFTFHAKDMCLKSVLFDQICE